MAPKQRPHKVCYTLAPRCGQHGHRLGINALAAGGGGGGDDETLFTAGRDGAVSAWALHGAAAAHGSSGSGDGDDGDDGAVPGAACWTQTWAHMHWVNDICLAHDGRSVISCSSDMTVKLWRADGRAASHDKPYLLGRHADYVKCLTIPHRTSLAVASGGLDRKIVLWDLAGAGERLTLQDEQMADDPKASVYALASTPAALFASGGPDQTIRLWDANSAECIAQLPGHLDNIRSILLSHDGLTALSGSSDSTIKLWDLRTRRCMNTLTMHSDSVRSLCSTHPGLKVFYAGDKTGLITKTDIRGVGDLDDAECLAIGKEHDGITGLAVAGNCIWACTSSSSFSCWLDAPPFNPLERPRIHARGRASSTASRNRMSAHSATSYQAASSRPHDESVQKFSRGVYLRLTSNVESLFNGDLQTTNHPHESGRDHDTKLNEPGYVRDAPALTVQGQHGIVRYRWLKDRRRVLTTDTLGEVAIWNIITGVQENTFGKASIDDLAEQLNAKSDELVPDWCQIDTRTGALTVILEHSHCFNAEIYADCLETPNLAMSEDHRINLGQWVLFNLFSSIVNLGIAKDREFLQSAKFDAILKSEQKRLERGGRSDPESTQPAEPPLVYRAGAERVKSGGSLLRRNLSHISISYGLPSPVQYITAESDQHTPSITATLSQASPLDYFSEAVSSSTTFERNECSSPPMISPNSVSSFMGRLKAFGSKKSSSMKTEEQNNCSCTSTATSTVVMASPVLETPPISEIGEFAHDAAEPITFQDVVTSIRKTYQNILDDLVVKGIEDPAVFDIESLITPVPPWTFPPCEQPFDATIFISEQRVDANSSYDVYRGTVATVGDDYEELIRVAPAWLAEILLQDKISNRRVVKINFSLKPYDESLPEIITAQSRLNANQMLRVGKILSYIAERLQEQSAPQYTDQPPQAWLEILCQNQLIASKTTLAMIRFQFWRRNNDLVLHYRLKK